MLRRPWGFDAMWIVNSKVINQKKNAPTDKPLIVFIEIAKKNRNKYKFNPKLNKIVLNHTLFTSITYPIKYKFIKKTLKHDGDPLNTLVLTNAPTFPKCQIQTRPIAMFRMTNQNNPNKKILCIPMQNPTWSALRDLTDVPDSLLREIEH